MAETTTLHLGIGVDTRDFAKLARALRVAAPDLAKTLQARLRAAGDVVASEARARAADASATIPPSIKVRVSGATVSVVAGGKNVPLAGLMELGNKKRRTAAATFRHPVFGNRNVWVDQPTHPYLEPVVRLKIDEVERLAVDALDAAVTEIVEGG